MAEQFHLSDKEFPLFREIAASFHRGGLLCLKVYCGRDLYYPAFGWKKAIQIARSFNMDAMVSRFLQGGQSEFELATSSQW